MDMEDIIFGILKKNPYSEKRKMADHIANFFLKPIMKEIVDFVDGQQTIECNNCRGRKFKYLKEAWQVR